MQSVIMKKIALWAVVVTFASLSLISASGQETTQAANTVRGASDAGVAPDKFIIGPNDVLIVNVWKEPEISRTLPVRSDGKISLPLIGELQAAGQTPKQLQEEIKEKLKAYISNPEVTIIVQEIKSQTFNVLGEVTRPGSYVLSKPTTVLDAIALAGGFKDFAKRKSMYVLRRTGDGKQERFPFNYSEVVKGKNLQQNLELRANDTVVVP